MKKLDAIHKKLFKEIVNEHVEMTKDTDGNMHYLWWLYKDGPKKDEIKPFMYAFEVKLLKSLDVITDEEMHNILNMLDSEDEENWYIALCSIQHLRDARIETHGNYTDLSSVSDMFKDIASKYPTTVVHLDKTIMRK